jgi:hypothetical protein
MKNIIFIICILTSVGLKAKDIDSENIKFVDVKSKKILINISKNELQNDAIQTIEPNRYQTTLTINASGVSSHQCNSVHKNKKNMHYHNTNEAIK